MNDEQAAGAVADGTVVDGTVVDGTVVDGTEKTGGSAGGAGNQGGAGRDGAGKSLLLQAADKSEGAGEQAGDVKEGEPDNGVQGSATPGNGVQGSATPGSTTPGSATPGEFKALTAEDFAGCIPEGKVWDEELGKSYLDIVNEAKIPPEVANKFLALYSGQQDKMLAAEQAAETAAREKYEAEIAGWEKAAKADKEYGGQKWDASQTAIVRGRDNLATPGAVAVLEEYNMSSHPEILRIFYRAGLLLSEDGGLAAGGGGTALKSDEEVFYGK
jgi:hypothetical protein